VTKTKWKRVWAAAPMTKICVTTRHSKSLSFSLFTA
jgi:hypothetical protein